eukprot:5109895-Pleurochrysis_carterae.AAC.1
MSAGHKHIMGGQLSTFAPQTPRVGSQVARCGIARKLHCINPVRSRSKANQPFCIRHYTDLHDARPVLSCGKAQSDASTLLMNRWGNCSSEHTALCFNPTKHAQGQTGVLPGTDPSSARKLNMVLNQCCSQCISATFGPRHAQHLQIGRALPLRP